MTTIFKTPSWPVCKVELNGEVMFYVGFSKEDALGVGKDEPFKEVNKPEVYHKLITIYKSHLPVTGLDALGGQKIESGPGYLLDVTSLKKYLEESCEDVAEIIQKIGDKMNPEKLKELKENLSSYEGAYREIFELN